MLAIGHTLAVAIALRRVIFTLLLSIALFPGQAAASIVAEWNKVALVEVRINSRDRKSVV